MTASGVHIHHSVPGIILLIIGAFTAVGGPDSLGWRSFAAVAVGTGTSLVLDEFALILHLQDVYWSGEGQLSVEAVSLTARPAGKTSSAGSRPSPTRQPATTPAAEPAGRGRWRVVGAAAVCR